MPVPNWYLVRVLARFVFPARSGPNKAGRDVGAAGSDHCTKEEALTHAPQRADSPQVQIVRPSRMGGGGSLVFLPSFLIGRPKGGGVHRLMVSSKLEHAQVSQKGILSIVGVDLNSG